VSSRIDLADVIRMLREVAPGHHARVANHRILIDYNGRTASLPKGPGRPKSANPRDLKGDVFPAYVRKLAQVFGLDPNKVNGHFPGLMPIENPAESELAPKPADPA